MTESLTRRGFLGRGAAAGLGVVLLGASDVLLTAPNAAAAPAAPGYGPLIPDLAGRLALPLGFRYSIVTEAGVTKLDSGEPTPSHHDGAGAFRGKAGGTTIVYNHEIRDPLATTPFPVPHPDGLVYDKGSAGGCTIVETDRDGNRVREYVGVAGTSTNCAGGITPWDTWLTCEETEDRAGAGGREKDHGYVFEVDPFDLAANRDPQRGDIILTEDASDPNGLLYRWTPPQGYKGRKGGLRALGPTDGVLGAMRCTNAAGAHVDDLSRGIEVGTTYDVTWVPVPDRDARTTSTRNQFGPDEITRGRKFEGAWWGDGGAYVVTSFAREESPVPHDGQVWFYDPRRSTLTLKLRFAPGGELDGPDNITVSSWGGLILAEDGEGTQHLVGVTEGGEAFELARNQVPGDSEFAGPVYSHDKKVLFASIQTPGIMYAITGPWRNQR